MARIELSVWSCTYRPSTAVSTKAGTTNLASASLCLPRIIDGKHSDCQDRVTHCQDAGIAHVLFLFIHAARCQYPAQFRLTGCAIASPATRFASAPFDSLR